MDAPINVPMRVEMQNAIEKFAIEVKRPKIANRSNTSAWEIQTMNSEVEGIEER